MFGYTSLAGTDIQAFAARNGRRKVFYAQPQGAATLIGLLSLAASENTDGPEFDWSEQRLAEKRAQLRGANPGVTGPWQTNIGGGGTSLAFANGAIARVYITSNETLHNWRVGEQIVIDRQTTTTPNEFVKLYAEITEVVIPDANTPTTGYFFVRLAQGITVNNESTQIGMSVTSMGVAMTEGSLIPGSYSGLWPVTVPQYTQIFRDVVGWTATALRQPLFFDIEGTYEKDIRDGGMKHMVAMENAALFGRRVKTNVIDEDGSPTVKRQMAGVYWYLQQWEAAGGGVPGYRPGGPALTTNNDDDKRIIQGPASGVLPFATWDLLEERIFRRTMNSSFEKLALGGTAFCAAILKYYGNIPGSQIRINRDLEDGLKISFKYHTVETRYGTLHVKSHPRFNDNPSWRGNGFILDLNNIRWRPMVGRDTKVQENVHQNGFDGRKDAWLTEAAIELRFPESHMYFENVTSIQNS